MAEPVWIEGGTITTAAGNANTGPLGASKLEDSPAQNGDAGSASLWRRNDNAATIFTDANGDYTQPGVDQNGALFTRTRPASAVPITTVVASSAASVPLIAANPARQGLSILNKSTAVLSINYGATATIAGSAVDLQPGAYWELPKPIATSAIAGIWATAAGTANVTEIV